MCVCVCVCMCVCVCIAELHISENWSQLAEPLLVLSGDAGSLLVWAVDAVLTLLALLVTLLLQKHKY